MPKFGVMYQPMQDVQIFADGAMSRDVPDLIDLTQSIFPPRPPWIANPNGTYGYQMNPLQAQKAWTGEVGSRGKWDRFSWDVTYYYSRMARRSIPASNTGFEAPGTRAAHHREMASRLPP
jgi:iron complex outermembrane recepter protein